MARYKLPVKNIFSLDPPSRGLKERLNIRRDGNVTNPRVGHVVEKLARAGYRDITVSVEVDGGFVKIKYVFCKKKSTRRLA